MIKTKTKLRISRKWLLFALVIFIFAAATAYAAAPATGTGIAGTTSNAFNTAMQTLANLLVALLSLLKKILWPIFLLIGGLLNNDLLFGAGMEDRILLIWTQIRNFVNIGFVLILVGVALYNVTGFAKEEYDIKKFIPKFAIALIAVNFSYLGLKIFLDVTNVFTVAIFAMPKTISADLVRTNSLALETTPGSGTFIQRCSENDSTSTDCATTTNNKTETQRIQDIVNNICSSLYGPVKDFKAPTNPEEKIFCEEGRYSTDTSTGAQIRNFALTQTGLSYFNSFTSNNAALILAIQFMNITDVDKVSTTLQTSTDFLKINLNLLFSTMLYIIYGVAYVSLFILLLVRLVVLWLILILSPLIALKLAGIKVAEGGDDYGKMFIQHAIAPLKVAVVLTIGYMMLDVFKHVKAMSLTDTSTLQTTINSLQTEVSGISTLQSFIMAAASVIFIWVGVKQATKETKAGTIIEGLMNKVQTAGKTVAGLWKYAPIIPTTGGAKASFMQLKSQINKPLRTLRERYGGEETGGELSISEIQALRRRRGLTGEELRRTARQLETGGFATERHAEETREVIKAWEKAHANPELTRALRTRMGGAEWARLMGREKLSASTKQSLRSALGHFAGPAPVGATPRAPAAPGARPGAPAQTPPAAGKTPEAIQAESLVAAQGTDNKGNTGWKNLSADEQTKVRALLDERNRAATGADVTKRAANVKAVEDKMKTDPVYQKAVAAVSASSDLETAAAPYKDKTEIKGADKNSLNAALKKAQDSLKAKNVDPTQIKQIIRQTLEKAGVKVDVVANDRQLQRYIQ